MDKFISLLAAPANVFWAAVVSATISAAVSYWFKRGENRHKAKVEYEYEQRKKQRELTGAFRGGILSAANSLMQRQWNLYRNRDQNWLNVEGGYDRAGYYFPSTVYRFLCLFGLIRQLEAEAILLDVRIAEKTEFVFLNYVAVLHWVMTDVALFDGIEYDKATSKDHFFSDNFRVYAEMCVNEGKLLNFEEFKSGPYASGELLPVLRFFDGLRADELRLRWDRLVALHLILMAFVNTFGYNRQRSSQQQFVDASVQIRNKEILRNLVNWLERHDLGRDREAKKIAKALRQQQLQSTPP